MRKMRYLPYILVISSIFMVFFIASCKNQSTGDAVVDIDDVIEESKPLPNLLNNSNQTYFVNKTIDYSKEAKIRISDAKEEISKTVILLKAKVSKKLISSRNKQKAEKLINNAELLLSKAEESYNKGLYENAIDLAVDAKIKSIEAKSVIG